MRISSNSPQWVRHPLPRFYEWPVDGGMATDWEWSFEYDADDRLSSVVPVFPED